MDEFIAFNRAHYQRYREQLADLPGLSVLHYDETESCNFQYIVLDLDSEIAGISRDDLVRSLHEQGVIARRYFYPGCHRMEPYRTLFPESGLNLPETEKLVQRLFCLPTGSSLTVADVDRVCDLVRQIMTAW